MKTVNLIFAMANSLYDMINAVKADNNLDPQSKDKLLDELYALNHTCLVITKEELGKAVEIE